MSRKGGEEQAQGCVEVAWAVVGNKSGEILNVFHGTREKLLADTKYWPEHGFRTRPLVYGDNAPPSAPVSGNPQPYNCTHRFALGEPRACWRCGWDFRNGDPPEPPSAPAAQGGEEVKCPECYGSGDYCLAGHSAHPNNWRKCEACMGSGTTPPSAPVGVAVAQVRRGGKGAPHDALYVGLIPRGPATPEVKEGDLLYLAQQPSAVDGATVERMVEAFLASTGQQHTVTQLQRDLTIECMKAALAAQPGGSDNG